MPRKRVSPDPSIGEAPASPAAVPPGNKRSSSAYKAAAAAPPAKPAARRKAAGAQPATPRSTRSRSKPGVPVAAAPDPFDPERYHEDIARLAYALWEQRGGQHGHHEDDWHRAEAIVRERRSIKGA